MNVVHLAAEDTRGGAARAVYRFHDLLRRSGHGSRMLVRRKYSHDDAVSEVRLSPWRCRRDALARRFAARFVRPARANYEFNFDARPPVETDAILRACAAADVVCLHWLDGLLSVPMIRDVCRVARGRVLRTLMDQEPITGGCHYTFGCEGYRERCGHCPQIEPSGRDDASSRLLARKGALLRGTRLEFLVGTGESAARVRRSAVFGMHAVHVTPWGFDTRTFRPFDPRAARDLLRLPQDVPVLFAGAALLDDRRKGMGLLVEALRALPARLPASAPRPFVVLAGLNGGPLLARQPFDGRCLGVLGDDLSLALAYQAADVFVSPSVQDEGPLMVPEAMLCGAPVVAFETGYAAALVTHGVNGWVCAAVTSDALADGIAAMLVRRGPSVRAHAAGAARARHSEEAFLAAFLAVCGAPAPAPAMETPP